MTRILGKPLYRYPEVNLEMVDLVHPLGEESRDDGSTRSSQPPAPPDSPMNPAPQEEREEAERAWELLDQLGVSQEALKIALTLSKFMEFEKPLVAMAQRLLSIDSEVAALRKRIQELEGEKSELELIFKRLGVDPHDLI